MKAEEKIYKAFYDAKNKRLYFSELKEKTKLSNSSLQNALKKLEKEKFLEIDKQTSNVFFRINENEKPIIFSQFDKIRLNNLNPEVRVPLKNWLNRLPAELYSVILFGSTSRKQEKEGSDIDLLVILFKFENDEFQKLYEKEIKQKINSLTKKINSESNYLLKVIFTNTDSFKITKDYLIKQAKETGFPIFGNLGYHKQNEEN
ncbi:MAG: nucleotidyltransferase domain-containing protein [Nanoarchaeota archaeon]|nr:nucleotidyltransferase domain-containing protein [Nanoarchaeota archaeon]